MKSSIVFMIVLLTNILPCNCQVRVNKMEIEKAKEVDYHVFFNHMIENKHFEKIAKNNYYIFDSISVFLYYGKVSAGIFNCKITTIYKTDINVLKREIPNYKKLSGYALQEIIVSKIFKTHKVTNQNEIVIVEISYKLEKNIIATVSYHIGNNIEKKEEYQINCTDFKIINHSIKQ